MFRFAILVPLAIVAALTATPVFAAPLQFDWSGVDSNDDPFSITYSVRDVQNGETGFNSNEFNTTGLFTGTETTTDTQVITNVTGDIFAGTYAFPTATSFDPYDYVATRDVGGNTVIRIFAGSDSSDIGLTYNGAPVDWVVVEGIANLPFISPATATSFAELFPVGTYTILPPDQTFPSEVTYNFNSEFITLIPTTLTISRASDTPANAVPEPATAALLGLGALGLLARRRRDRVTA
jgi:hypothetical protein